MKRTQPIGHGARQLYAPPYRRCSCLREYITRADFEKLPLVGHGDKYPAELKPGQMSEFIVKGYRKRWVCLEHRNCPCGNTMVVEVPYDAVRTPPGRSQ